MRSYKAAPLTVEEQDALAIRAKAGDLEARNRLVASVMPMIAGRVVKCSRRDEDREDYVQEAALHIIESISRYDPKRGAFYKFAMPWSDGGRTLWKRKQGWVRCQVGLSFVSIHKPIFDGRKTICDTLYTPPDDSLEHAAMLKEVRGAIPFAGLTQQERELLRAAMGMEMCPGFQTHCARLMGTSRQRVGQLWLGNGPRTPGLKAKLRSALAPIVLEGA